MAKFLTGKDLNEKIYDIIWDASETLYIISPYIKLDAYFRNLFEKHLENHKLEMIIVFGKEESKLRSEDFNFFKQFPNISIIYVPNLHAKYYGNEGDGIITSINLYDYSFNNNIEFGVTTETSLFSFKNSLDLDAFEECNRIIDNNNVIFAKRPVFEKKILGKTFIKSTILIDEVATFVSGNGKYKKIKYAEVEKELYLGNINDKARPDRETFLEKNKTQQANPKYTSNSTSNQNHESQGYCIRTGNPIPYNPKQPMSYEAYKVWVKYSDLDFKEQFCHKSGKPSYGKTSMRKPILYY